MHTPKRRLRRPNDSGAVVPERINRRGAKSQTTNKVPHVEQKNQTPPSFSHVFCCYWLTRPDREDHVVVACADDFHDEMPRH
jgi:hypothetical protein